MENVRSVSEYRMDGLNEKDKGKMRGHSAEIAQACEHEEKKRGRIPCSQR